MCKPGAFLFRAVKIFLRDSRFKPDCFEGKTFSVPHVIKSSLVEKVYVFTPIILSSTLHHFQNGGRRGDLYKLKLYAFRILHYCILGLNIFLLLFIYLLNNV